MHNMRTFVKLVVISEEDQEEEIKEFKVDGSESNLEILTELKRKFNFPELGALRLSGTNFLRIGDDSYTLQMHLDSLQDDEEEEEGEDDEDVKLIEVRGVYSRTRRLRVKHLGDASGEGYKEILYVPVSIGNKSLLRLVAREFGLVRGWQLKKLGSKDGRFNVVCKGAKSGVFRRWAGSEPMSSTIRAIYSSAITLAVIWGGEKIRIPDIELKMSNEDVVKRVCQCVGYPKPNCTRLLYENGKFIDPRSEWESVSLQEHHENTKEVNIVAIFQTSNIDVLKVKMMPEGEKVVKIQNVDENIPNDELLETVASKFGLEEEYEMSRIKIKGKFISVNGKFTLRNYVDSVEGWREQKTKILRIRFFPTTNIDKLVISYELDKSTSTVSGVDINIGNSDLLELCAEKMRCLRANLCQVTFDDGYNNKWTLTRASPREESLKGFVMENNVSLKCVYCVLSYKVNLLVTDKRSLGASEDEQRSTSETLRNVDVDIDTKLLLKRMAKKYECSSQFKNCKLIIVGHRGSRRPPEITLKNTLTLCDYVEGEGAKVSKDGCIKMLFFRKKLPEEIKSEIYEKFKVLFRDREKKSVDKAKSVMKTLKRVRSEEVSKEGISEKEFREIVLEIRQDLVKKEKKLNFHFNLWKFWIKKPFKFPLDRAIISAQVGQTLKSFTTVRTFVKFFREFRDNIQELYGEEEYNPYEKFVSKFQDRFDEAYVKRIHKFKINGLLTVFFEMDLVLDEKRLIRQWTEYNDGNDYGDVGEKIVPKVRSRIGQFNFFSELMALYERVKTFMRALKQDCGDVWIGFRKEMKKKGYFLEGKGFVKKKQFYKERDHKNFFMVISFYKDIGALKHSEVHDFFRHVVITIFKKNKPGYKEDFFDYMKRFLELAEEEKCGSLLKKFFLFYMNNSDQFKFRKRVKRELRRLKDDLDYMRRLLDHDCIKKRTEGVEAEKMQIKKVHRVVNKHASALQKQKEVVKKFVKMDNNIVFRFAKLLLSEEEMGPIAEEIKRAKKVHMAGLGGCRRYVELIKILRKIMEFQKLFKRYKKEFTNLLKGFIKNPKVVTDQVEKAENKCREVVSGIKQLALFQKDMFKELGEKCEQLMNAKLKFFEEIHKQIGDVDDEETFRLSNPFLAVEMGQDETYNKYNTNGVPLYRICPWCLRCEKRNSDACKHTTCTSCNKEWCQMCMRAKAPYWQCGNAYDKCNPNLIHADCKPANEPRHLYPLQTPLNAQYWYMGATGTYNGTQCVPSNPELLAEKIKDFNEKKRILERPNIAKRLANIEEDEDDFFDGVEDGEKDIDEDDEDALERWFEDSEAEEEVDEEEERDLFNF